MRALLLVVSYFLALIATAAVVRADAQTQADTGAPAPAAVGFEPYLSMPTPELKAITDTRAAKKPKSQKWSFSLMPVSLQKNPVLDFTIITELTDEGRKLPPPSFDNPVYYISHSTGQHDEGQSYGGEQPMQIGQLKTQLTRALASNGYRPAEKEHPPSQILFLVWGVHAKLAEIEMPDAAGGGDPEDGDAGGGGAGGMSFGNSTAYFKNLLSRAQLVGGKKFAQDFAQALRDRAQGMGIIDPVERLASRDDVTRSLVEQVYDDCYYLVVSAYEAEAFINKEKKLLWRTKMSTAAQGVSLEQTMPGLIDNGAYFFGREMKTPEIVTKRVIKEGRVHIGEAEVKEYIQPDSGTTAPKKPKSEKR